MALHSSDTFLVNRNGTNYQLTAAQLLDEIGSSSPDPTPPSSNGGSNIEQDLNRAVLIGYSSNVKAYLNGTTLEDVGDLDSFAKGLPEWNNFEKPIAPRHINKSSVEALEVDYLNFIGSEFLNPSGEGGSTLGPASYTFKIDDCFRSWMFFNFKFFVSSSLTQLNSFPVTPTITANVASIKFYFNSPIDAWLGTEDVRSFQITIGAYLTEAEYDNLTINFSWKFTNRFNSFIVGLCNWRVSNSQRSDVPSPIIPIDKPTVSSSSAVVNLTKSELDTVIGDVPSVPQDYKITSWKAAEWELSENADMSNAQSSVVPIEDASQPQGLGAFMLEVQSKYYTNVKYTSDAPVGISDRSETIEFNTGELTLPVAGNPRLIRFPISGFEPNGNKVYLRDRQRFLVGGKVPDENGSNSTALYYTDDAAKSWHRISLPPVPGNGTVNSITVDAFNHNRMVIATSNKGGILLSSDGGETWFWTEETTDVIPSTEEIKKIVFTSTGRMIIGTIYKWIYYSDDNFNTVTQVNLKGNANNEIIDLITFIYNEREIIIQVQSGVINISEDNGETWTQVDVKGQVGTSNLIYPSYSEYNNTLYMISASKIIQSTDGGYNWTLMDPAPSQSTIKSLITYSKGLYCFSSSAWFEHYDMDAGVWTKDDRWINQNNSFLHPCIGGGLILTSLNSALRCKHVCDAEVYGIETDVITFESISESVREAIRAGTFTTPVFAAEEETDTTDVVEEEAATSDVAVTEEPEEPTTTY